MDLLSVENAEDIDILSPRSGAMAPAREQSHGTAASELVVIHVGIQLEHLKGWRSQQSQPRGTLAGRAAHSTKRVEWPFVRDGVADDTPNPVTGR